MKPLTATFLFPSNRKTLWHSVQTGEDPDTLLYGFNHLTQFGIRAHMADVDVKGERRWSLLCAPFSSAFHSRFTRINLGRVIAALPSLQKTDVIVTEVDSTSKAVLFLKRVGFISKPIICMAGNVMDGTERFQNVHRWLWSAASRIVTHAPVDQEKLLGMGLGDLGAMIPVGSDVSFYKPSTSNSQKNLIASIGSDRDRDYETLVRAVGRLPNMKLEIHLSIRQLHQLSKPVNVKFVTNASSISSRDLLRRAEIVVIPLKETFRAAGQLALLDALLMRKPVIISATRGVIEPYHLKHKNTVFLVQPGNSDTLARGIRELQGNLPMCRRMRTNGRQLALRYTTRSYAKKFSGIIKETFNEKEISSTDR